MMLIASFTIQTSIEIGTSTLPINTTTKGVHVCQVISLDVEWIHWPSERGLVNHTHILLKMIILWLPFQRFAVHGDEMFFMWTIKTHELPLNANHGAIWTYNNMHKVLSLGCKKSGELMGSRDNGNVSWKCLIP
jgi:hypothetical protein